MTILPLVITASLIDSLNPCAFSILLLTIAFLFSLGRTRANIVKVGSCYILAIFLIYTLIGLGTLQVLSFFNIPHFMSKIGAVILILAGLINLIGELWPKFPIHLKIPGVAHAKLAKIIEKGSLHMAFLLGVLVGIYEFPCTGGPYLMILGLLHDKATFLSGLSYLILYNFIFVLPLIVILIIASDHRLLTKVQAWRKSKISQMKLLDSIVMIILGIIIFLV